MKNLFKVIGCFSIILLISTNLLSCNKINNDNNKNLKIILEDPKSIDNDFINTIFEEYKKENENIKINIKNTKGLDETLEVIKKEDYDIILCGRQSMMELSRRGIIKNISELYKANKINERFYNIVCSYGKAYEEYFGLGLMPYSIEMLCKKEDIPFNIDGSIKLDENNFKTLLSKNKGELPVIVPKELDFNLTTLTYLSNNLITYSDIENKFDESKENYLGINKMQNVFYSFNLFLNILKENNVTLVKEEDKNFEAFFNGDKKLIITCTAALGGLESKEDIKTISNLFSKNYHISPPVVVEHIVCSFTGTDNKSEVNKFLDYICRDEIYITLGKKGFLSGNMKGTHYTPGLINEMVWTIKAANENNIPFYLNLPKKIEEEIKVELKSISEGKYSGNEWQNIIERVYKQ
ncbi:hypothetical protein [Clostridium fallax]|uniref:Carbohydrate ABC transporter substrate-binding protein, CUT1 family n=1 Tax=Clostridium fallax TaxID=1533 RepID=A0A1M4U3N3_9CLOT|nr:hypothetical protein [Clostridium fallax]SHE51285.1 carbohydrate ABC transporter substrate-binding protein, CUT1 family [Clostridium fallax]SQB06060.1 extracellular solute-binding protein [Clostridium fallax]